MLEGGLVHHGSGVDGDAHAGALWAPVGCHGDLGVRVGACVPSG